MRRERTDPIENAADLIGVSKDVVNISIQQSGSDPFHSLLEGDSKLRYTVATFSDNLHRGTLDDAKLRRLKNELLHASAYAMRMVVMIETELDRL